MNATTVTEQLLLVSEPHTPPVPTEPYAIARNTPVPYIATSATSSVEWFTPSEYVEAARTAMGTIDCDPASCDVAQGTVQATFYFTRERDGLRQPWRGNVWLNPPYGASNIGAFTAKLKVELDAGNVTQACILTNACTDTIWFQRLARMASAVLFSRKRIRFMKADGVERDSPTHGQALFYLGLHVERFRSAFAGLCYECGRGR